MDKCTVRVKVRHARGDDVKDTQIKENKKEKEHVYCNGDIPTRKSNLDIFTNLVGVLIQGRVMLDPL